LKVPGSTIVTAVGRTAARALSYTAFRSGEGGLTVTVCQDKTGTDESSRRAAEWVKENIRATAGPPTITEGSTVVHFNSQRPPRETRRPAGPACGNFP
jgi:hypothetical protein